jgi:hypothetical protein
LKQQPGESESAYMKRLQHLASSTDALMAAPQTTTTTTAATNATTNGGSAPPKKSGYVRAEDWDAEVKARPSNSWEERVQFDGLKVSKRARDDVRMVSCLPPPFTADSTVPFFFYILFGWLQHGNGFNQNEILRRNLNSF